MFLWPLSSWLVKLPDVSLCGIRQGPFIPVSFSAIQGNFCRAQIAASFEHAFATLANRNRTRFPRAIFKLKYRAT